jgi:4a-hydroxytetrahydrobiopterin dehydratase
MSLLADDEVDAQLARRAPLWTRDGLAIARTVVASSYLEGIDLVRRVAEAAEQANHHPDIEIAWTSVTFTLATHSEGGVTDKDIAMATQIDALV